MAEETKPTEQQEQTQTEASAEEVKTVPYDRFKEVNDKYKTLTEEISGLRSQLKEREQKQLEEKEEYKKLYEDVKPKIDEYENTLNKYRSFAQIEFDKEYNALDDENKKFIDEFLTETDPYDKMHKFNMLKPKLIKGESTRIQPSDTAEGSENGKHPPKASDSLTVDDFLGRLRNAKTIPDRNAVMKEFDDWKRSRGI